MKTKNWCTVRHYHHILKWYGEKWFRDSIRKQNNLLAFTVYSSTYVLVSLTNIKWWIIIRAQNMVRKKRSMLQSQADISHHKFTKLQIGRLLQCQHLIASYQMTSTFIYQSGPKRPSPCTNPLPSLLHTRSTIANNEKKDLNRSEEKRKNVWFCRTFKSY